MALNLLTGILCAEAVDAMNALYKNEPRLLKIAALKNLLNTLNPFQLAQTIEERLQRIFRLANIRQGPKAPIASRTGQKAQRSLTKVERESFYALSNIFPALIIYVKDSKQPR